MSLFLLCLGRKAATKAYKHYNPNKKDGEPQSRASALSKTRLFAILPVTITAIAFLLSFLWVYAGHTPGMMDEYAVFTLNTSRIGENLREKLDNNITSALHFSKRSESTLTPTITAAPTTMITMAPRGVASDVSRVSADAASVASHVTSAAHSDASVAHSKLTSAASGVISEATSALGAVETKVIAQINSAWDGLISDIHLKDFYALHISTTCEGTYVFHNGTNITVGNSSLPGKGTHERVDSCSPHSAIDPLNLVKILYWIGIIFTGCALALGIAGIAVTSRKMALYNIFGTLPAFVFLGLASAVTHGISVGAAKLINFIGGDIGVAGDVGRKFLALTWATTALLLANMLLWGLLFFLRGRATQGEAAGQSGSLMGGRRSMRRPDRTSQVAAGEYGLGSLPPQQPGAVYDRHGNQMI